MAYFYSSLYLYRAYINHTLYEYTAFPTLLYMYSSCETSCMLSKTNGRSINLACNKSYLVYICTRMYWLDILSLYLEKGKSILQYIQYSLHMFPSLVTTRATQLSWKFRNSIIFGTITFLFRPVWLRVGNLSPASWGEESIPGTESGIE